jgi:hypothetical protein
MILISIVKIASLIWQCTCIFMCHHQSTHIMFNIFYFQVELHNFRILSLILMWDTNFTGDRVEGREERNNKKVIGLCNRCTVTYCTEQWELMSPFQKWHLTHMTSTFVVDQATKVTSNHSTNLSQKTLHKPHWLKLIAISQETKCPIRDRWNVPYSFGLNSQQPILQNLKSMKSVKTEFWVCQSLMSILLIHKPNFSVTAKKWHSVSCMSILWMNEWLVFGLQPFCTQYT